MGSLGGEYLNFFISFWLNGVVSSSSANNWKLVNFYTNSLIYLNNTALRFINNGNSFINVSSLAVPDNIWILHVKFNKQKNYILLK